MAEARLDLDIDREIAAIALQYAPLAEDGAEMIASEIRASIPDLPGPSSPGQPPHSPGPLRDSFKHTKAKRQRRSIVAWAFSLAKTEGGEESLPELLDKGSPRTAARPFLDAAVARARRKFAALLARENSRR